VAAALPFNFQYGCVRRKKLKLMLEKLHNSHIYFLITQALKNSPRISEAERRQQWLFK